MKNGETVKVWTDFWLPMGTLRSLIKGPLYREEEHITIKQCVDHNHDWQAGCLSFELPTISLMPLKQLHCLVIMRQKTRSNGSTPRMDFSP